MRQVVLKARELFDVDVEFISLVGRPANRIPFSFTKSEDSSKKGGGMFDNLFRKSEQKSFLTAVVLKSAPTEAVLKALTDAGVSTDSPQEVDGVTVLPQDNFSGDTMLVKLSDDVAVQVPAFKMEGDFAAVCAQRGVYPAISIATDMLNMEIFKAMEKSDSPATAASKIGAVTNDFGSYMAQLVRGMPAEVFKLEKSEDLTAAFRGDVEKAAKKSPQAAAEDNLDGGADDSEEGPNGEKMPKAGKTQAKGKVAQTQKAANTISGANSSEDNDLGTGGADLSGDNHTADHQPGDVLKKKKKKVMQKQDDGTEIEVEVDDDDGDAGSNGAQPAFDVAALTKSITDALMPAIDAKLEPLNAKIEQVAESAGKAVEKADNASRVVRKSVLGGAFDMQGDEEPTSVEKTDREIPLLDTGFSVRR